MASLNWILGWSKCARKVLVLDNIACTQTWSNFANSFCRLLLTKSSVENFLQLSASFFHKLCQLKTFTFAPAIHWFLLTPEKLNFRSDKCVKSGKPVCTRELYYLVLIWRTCNLCIFSTFFPANKNCSGLLTKDHLLKIKCHLFNLQKQTHGTVAICSIEHWAYRVWHLYLLISGQPIAPRLLTRG